jgi:hypothetical protein
VKLGDASLNASDRVAAPDLLGAAFTLAGDFFERTVFAGFLAAMSLPPGGRGYD